MVPSSRISYYAVFFICFAAFNLVQDVIRPNYSGSSELVAYLLGVAPNFLPAIGLPALFYVLIADLFSKYSSAYKYRLGCAIWLSLSGLIANEFATLLTDGRGVFDWHDILWTLLGGLAFYLPHRFLKDTEHAESA